MWIVASIAAPVIGILLLIIWNMTRETETHTTVIDPNKDLAALERQVPEMQRDLREAFKAWQDEDPSARRRIDELKSRCNAWMEQFDAIVNAKENNMVDANGRLLAGFERWGQVRSDVSRLRGDIIKNFP